MGKGNGSREEKLFLRILRATTVMRILGVCTRQFRDDYERNVNRKETDRQWRTLGGQLAEGKNDDAKKRSKEWLLTKPFDGAVWVPDNEQLLTSFSCRAVRHRCVHHGLPVLPHNSEPDHDRGRAAVPWRPLLQSALHGLLWTVQHRPYGKDASVKP